MKKSGFNAAGKNLTDASGVRPISFYPPWYARVFYWLNSSGFRQKPSLGYRIKGAYEFPLLEKSDLPTLMKVAQRHGLDIKNIERPDPHKYFTKAYIPGSEQITASQDALNDAIKSWLHQIDVLLAELEPFVRDIDNLFSKNLSIICELNELSPVEREILALYYTDNVARYIRNMNEDEERQGFAASIADFLGASEQVDWTDKKLQGTATLLFYNRSAEIINAALIATTLFESGQLFESFLLLDRSADFGADYNYFIDENTADLLDVPGLTKESALANIIGTPLESELDYKKDFDYLPFFDELLDSTLGSLGRASRLGKISCLVGLPGAGKSKLPKVLATYIESIMRKTEADFSLPVYVIGTEKDSPFKRRGRIDTMAKKDDDNSTAARRDIIKVLRARRTLQSLGVRAFLVIEEADGILSSQASSKGDNITRAHAHQILDESPVLTWLISNHPEEFDDAVRRRIKTYDMGAPPADKRQRMIAKIAKEVGFDVAADDARLIAQEFVFTPGVIESALLHTVDYVRGREIRLGREIKAFGLDELLIGFRRKAISLAGTNVRLVQKLAVAETLSIGIYQTGDLEPYELEELVTKRVKPRLWTLAGDPATEIRELALYAASRYGDPYIIQIGAYGADLLEQLEAAKREKAPVVITGFEAFIRKLSLDEMRNHPFLIAVQDQVSGGQPVFIVVEMMPAQIAGMCKAILSEAGRSFVGFELATGLDLYQTIKKISGLTLSDADERFMAYPFEHPNHRGDSLSPLTTRQGIVIAGPKDVRNAVATIRADGMDLSIERVVEVMTRQGVFCTFDRDQIKHLTGLTPKPLQNHYH